MMYKIIYPYALGCFLLLISSCSSTRKSSNTVNKNEIKSTVKLKKKIPAVSIHTNDVKAESVVRFAETLQGVQYKYGGTKRETGFDCSGFIGYVFNHFNIKVPRVSSDFTNAGTEVSIKESKRGDLILFTGSDAKSGIVGHMGIITKNSKEQLLFIHSASGGGKGVMISGMNTYFIDRFVKVIRVFKDDE